MHSPRRNIKGKGRRLVLLGPFPCVLIKKHVIRHDKKMLPTDPSSHVLCFFMSLFCVSCYRDGRKSVCNEKIY